MCLIAFAIGQHDDEPVRLASNRDEFFDRPTAPMHWWTLANGTRILAGRDLREGGTWLGLSDSGRVAMLTNVRSARAGTGARSRGDLVTAWLGSQETVTDWARSLDPQAYGGFNLVVGDWTGQQWHWLSNRAPTHPHTDDSPGLFQRALKPGVYGLSNASLNTPWPKSERLRSAVGQGVVGHTLDVLAQHQPALTDALPVTGVPPDTERALSSPFVHMPERAYGTRSSATLSIRRTLDAVGLPAWHAQVKEWTHELRPQHAWSALPPVCAEAHWRGA